MRITNQLRLGKDSKGGGQYPEQGESWGEYAKAVGILSPARVQPPACYDKQAEGCTLVRELGLMPPVRIDFFRQA